MKIYVEKHPMSCNECPLLTKPTRNGYYKCMGHKILLGYNMKSKSNVFLDCPLQPLPKDDKWEKLKEWLREDAYWLWCEEEPHHAQEVLDKMEELEKGE